jgi:hypothetical protein
LFSIGPAGPNMAGTLYALDLSGALVGALVITSFAVPLFGIYSTLYAIAGVNLAIAGFLRISKIWTGAAITVSASSD